MNKAEKAHVRASREEPAVEGTAQRAASPTTKLDAEGGGNLDKVRDILFGAQLRDTDKKLQRAEERMQREVAELHDESKRKLDALSAHFQNELEALSLRLSRERDERDEAVARLSNDWKERELVLQKRLATLDEQGQKSQRELRQQLAEQSSNLAEDARKRSEEQAQLVTRLVGELREEKADRRALAAMFGELALRLSEEPAGSTGG